MKALWNRIVWCWQQVVGHQYENIYRDGSGQKWYVTWRMRWGRCYDEKREECEGMDD